MTENIYFVSGIDTNVGKSYATGFIAKKWADEGKKVITQKFIQTGNTDVSEDIIIHRKLMNIALNADDKEFLTMPEIFSYPCSPHLAATIDKREINLDKIQQATKKLAQKYEKILLEGAGGLMVPITQTYLTIDYIAENNLPLIFVTSGKLGSINHTLLSFEAIKKRNINLKILAYNEFLNNEEYDEIIAKDNFNFIKEVVKKEFPQTEIIKIPTILAR